MAQTEGSYLPGIEFLAALAALVALIFFATPIVEFLKKIGRPLRRLVNLAWVVLVVVVIIAIIAKLPLLEFLLAIAVVLLWVVHRDIQELVKVVRSESARHDTQTTFGIGGNWTSGKS
jgi:hypothetical protein